MGLFDKLSLLGEDKIENKFSGIINYIKRDGSVTDVKEDKIDKYNYVLQTILLNLYVVKYYLYQNERNVVFEVETFTKYVRERKEFIYPRNLDVFTIESNFKRDYKEWTDSILTNIMSRLYF